MKSEAKHCTRPPTSLLHVACYQGDVVTGSSYRGVAWDISGLREECSQPVAYELVGGGGGGGTRDRMHS